MSGFYSGAVDLSGREAGFALLDDSGRAVKVALRPMRGRESAGLAVWVEEQLTAAGVSLDVLSATLPPMSMALCAALMIAFSAFILLLSYTISVRIMERREF